MITDRTCVVSGCGNKTKTIGYCGRHYKKHLRWGDALGGRSRANGLPMKFVQDVALHFQGDDCLIWPFRIGKHGYARIDVDGHSMHASRYICILVHGNPNPTKLEAAHSCGKGHLACVNPRHLSWKTAVENQADKVIHGTDNRGVRHGMAKLTEADVLEIIKLSRTQSQRNIAKKYSVGRSQIQRICAGKDWSSLTARFGLEAVRTV